jgi:gliding motility-associated-like protein
MKDQNIEQLFKNGFSHFEADVNPNMWTNIQQGLQSPVPAQEVAGNVTSAGKSIGLWGYAGMFVAATAVIVTAWLYNSDKNTSDKITAVTQPAASVISDGGTTKISEPVAVSEISKVEEKKNSVVEETSVSNTKSEEKTVPPVQEEPVTVEKQSPENKAEIVPPVTKDNTEDTQPEITEPSSRNTPHISAGNVTVTTSVSVENVQPTENEFDFEFASVDNGIPHEQQSRSDFSFYIPTVFTPNGDRVNDDFKPMGLNFKDFEMVIYDANNVEVFRSKDIEHRWDGKLKNGVPAPAGTYIYVISVKDLSNIEHPQRGQLLLKR